jgi:GNAT superfamily N-acetyltransferase
MRQSEPFTLPGYSVRLLSLADQQAAQMLLEACTDYSLLAAGQPVSPEAGVRLLVDGPPGKPAEDKFVSGLFSSADELVGVIDAIRDFPEMGTWFIGLMLVDPAQRSQGLGKAAVQAFEEWVSESGAREIQLEVWEQNVRALKFWQGCGFQIIYHQPPRRFGKLENRAYLLSHKIS